METINAMIHIGGAVTVVCVFMTRVPGIGFVAGIVTGFLLGLVIAGLLVSGA